jgi:hypothetical protein
MTQVLLYYSPQQSSSNERILSKWITSTRQIVKIIFCLIKNIYLFYIFFLLLNSKWSTSTFKSEGQIPFLLGRDGPLQASHVEFQSGTVAFTTIAMLLLPKKNTIAMVPFTIHPRWILLMSTNLQSSTANGYVQGRDEQNSGMEWKKHLTKKEVQRLVHIKFIDDGWCQTRDRLISQELDLINHLLNFHGNSYFFYLKQTFYDFYNIKKHFSIIKFIIIVLLHLL